MFRKAVLKKRSQEGLAHSRRRKIQQVRCDRTTICFQSKAVNGSSASYIVFCLRNLSGVLLWIVSTIRESGLLSRWQFKKWLILSKLPLHLLFSACFHDYMFLVLTSALHPITHFDHILVGHERCFLSKKACHYFL